MRILDDHSVGVIVDVQEKLLPHMTDALEVERRTVRLLQGLRILEIPLLYTEQYPKGLGPTVPAIAAELSDREPIVKASFSCCDDEPFVTALEGTGRRTVILAGIETHVCMLQTTIDLIGKGYAPVIVADATSSRSPRDRDVAFQRMRGEGAVITTVESILFELTRVSGTPRFKEISRLIK